MVQGYYSLKEAAERLGMPVEELNQMAQKRQVRAFADSGSWKFRQQDIEELARTRELGSTPEIRLADRGTIGLDDEQVVLDAGGVANENDDSATIIGKAGDSDSDVRLVVSGTSDSDSEVKLVPDAGTKGDDLELGSDIIRAPSDSDIRLAFDDPAMREGSGAGLEQTEEIKVGADINNASDSASGILKKEKKGSDSEIEFKFGDDELGTGFKVEGDSDLDLALDSVDDVGASSGTNMKSPDLERTVHLDPKTTKMGVGSGSESGINLADPNDSGISLDSRTDTSDSEFELSLESDGDIFDSDELPGFKDEDEDAPKVKTPTPASKGKKDLEATSDSDFELAIDEDFEVEEESGSEVVAIDEDSTADDDEEEDDIVDVEEEFVDRVTPVAGAAAAAGARRVVTVTPVAAPWPSWLVAPLSITLVLLIVVGAMMFEVMRNAWSYNTPYTMSGTITNQVYEIAKMVGLAK